MKALRNILIPVLLIFMVSCEELLDDPQTVAERLEGRWSVIEDTPKKSTDNAYEIYIDISVVDSNRILISNFYELGYSYDIYADINGMRLDVPTQEFANEFTVRGSATI